VSIVKEEAKNFEKASFDMVVRDENKLAMIFLRNEHIFKQNVGRQLEGVTVNLKAMLPYQGIQGLSQAGELRK